jgi:uncharacterized membrane protein YsdA (DUF1294 family)/cold shock CspA family protein
MKPVCPVGAATPRIALRYRCMTFYKAKDMRTKGKITSWNDEKGFGFITPFDGKRRVFVHIKAFGNRNRRPEINQVVTYDLSTDNQGRICAVSATLAGDRLPQDMQKKYGPLPVIIAAVFLVIVSIAVVASRIPPVILGIYLVASLMTFIVYAMDKSAARKGAWRTQESTLHLLSLAGGWPGALVAQNKLRHKSRKASFRTVFWMTVLLNCGVFVWMTTSTGAAALQSFIGSVVK